MNILENFCKLYHIVHVAKTKVMVFILGGRLRAIERFFYKGAKLEIVYGFQYVGSLFTPKLSMYRMTDDLAKKPNEY